MMQASHIAHFFERDEFPKPWVDLVDRVLRFVVQNDRTGRVMGSAGEDRKIFLIQYHLCKQTLEVSTHDNQIEGVCMWYCFRHPWTWGQIDRWRPDDKDGDAIVIGHILAITKRARQQLLVDIGNKILPLEGKRFYSIRKNQVIEYQPRHVRRFMSN